ncbi:MAG: EpsG family protein [Shinella sp.]
MTNAIRKPSTASPAAGNGAIMGGAIGLATLAIFAPVLAVAAAVIGVVLTSRRAVPAAGFAAVGIVAALLAWVNAGKGIRGDWVWYTTHFGYLETLPLDQYLGQRIGQYNPEVTEPIYYALSSVVSRLTGANIEVLAVTVTLLIYVAIGTAIVLAISTYTTRGWTLVAATITGMLTGITFTLSTQLVRQEIAASFIGLGIVLFGLKKWVPGALALAAGVLSHNSALIPAAGIILAVLLARANRGWFLRVVVSMGIFFALGRIYLIQSGNNFEGRSDGTIGTAVIALDVAVLLVFGTLVLRTSLGQNPVARIVLLCLPAFYGFLLAVVSQPIPLLRMYFYVEVLRALMIAFIVVWAMRGRLRIAVGVVAVIVSILYLQLRIDSSPFEYAADFLQVLFASPFLGPIG